MLTHVLALTALGVVLNDILSAVNAVAGGALVIERSSAGHRMASRVAGEVSGSPALRG